jgi:putative transposase
VLLKRLSGLFVIEPATRRVQVVGVTANPAGQWAAQQARKMLMDLADRVGRFKFLICDRDTKFTDTFDAVFASERIRTLPTPVRAPRANADAERWIGTVCRELLDRTLIMGHGICCGCCQSMWRTTTNIDHTARSGRHHRSGSPHRLLR